MNRPDFHETHTPHWRRPHIGEHHWPVTFVVSVVIILQYLLPKSLSLGIQPDICIVEATLTIILFAINPGRFEVHRKSAWWTGIVLTGVMTASNIASAIDLVRRLIDGTIKSPSNLLAFGGSIWLTNIVVFSLWY